jgi:hypothetical protein
LGRGLPVISKAELLGANARQNLRSHEHSRAGWWGFSESP